MLAALNEIDLQAARIEDYARPEGYWARLVKRWTEQYRAAETDTCPAVEALISALPRAVPSVSYTPSLVHGDFRLDNFVIDEGGKIRAVLDWELSTLGCPYADLAWQCAQWRLPAGDMRGLAGVDRRALGIPTEEEYVAEYCVHRGIPGIPQWNFYLAASLFRLAGICQGIYRRGLEGNASSSEALGLATRPTWLPIWRSTYSRIHTTHESVRSLRPGRHRDRLDTRHWPRNCRAPGGARRAGCDLLAQGAGLPRSRLRNRGAVRRRHGDWNSRLNRVEGPVEVARRHDARSPGSYLHPGLQCGIEPLLRSDERDR